MDFGTYLKKAASECDREVEMILVKNLNEAEKTDKKLIPLLQAFGKSCQGGKRIRAALVKLGYQIAGGESDEIVKIGAAYEVLHAAILVHDDIIDQSETRRDKLSLHFALSAEKGHVGGSHYGVSQAISLADYGFFLAVKIISESRFSNERKTKALEVFSGTMIDTAFGQMLELKKADPVTVMKLKTARYTISGPLQLGAALAGANEELVGALGEFGEKLGIVFQIKDDILDGEVDDSGDARKSAEKYINQAVELLPAIAKTAKMSKLLEQMSDYLLNRTK